MLLDARRARTGRAAHRLCGARGVLPAVLRWARSWRDVQRGAIRVVQVNRDVVREFCAENATLVEFALDRGARRIELCDNLAVGGTSPSPGVTARVVEVAHARGAAVMCMVRPRGGDFVYDADELRAMELDIESHAHLGADGVVFGCVEPLDPQAYREARTREQAGRLLPGACYEGPYALDRAACERLCRAASDAARRRGRALDITFHMAFDVLSAGEQLAGIDWLASRGVARILTHGGPAGTAIADNLERLRELMAYAAGRLAILPGAGITHANAADIAEALGAAELHGTKIV